MAVSAALVHDSSLIPKISFQRLGVISQSGDYGYIISRIPLETLVAKIRLHELLCHQYTKIAQPWNGSMPHYYLAALELSMTSEELVYRLSVLLTLLETSDDNKLSILDGYISDHLQKVLDLKSYVDRNGSFESLMAGLAISDDEFSRINDVNPFVDPFQALKVFPNPSTESSPVANSDSSGTENEQGNLNNQPDIDILQKVTTVKGIPWFNWTQKTPTPIETQMTEVPILDLNINVGLEALNNTGGTDNLETETESAPEPESEPEPAPEPESEPEPEPEPESNPEPEPEILAEPPAILDDSQTDNISVPSVGSNVKIVNNSIILTEGESSNDISNALKTNQIGPLAQTVTQRNLTDTEADNFDAQNPTFQPLDLKQIFNDCQINFAYQQPANFTSMRNNEKSAHQKKILAQLKTSIMTLDTNRPTGDFVCLGNKISSNQQILSGVTQAPASRQKRQIGEVIASLSFANSIYNSVKIEKIQGQMGHLSSLVDTVISSMSIQLERLNVLTKKIQECFLYCTQALTTIGQMTANLQLSNLLHHLKISQNEIENLLTAFELGLEKLSLDRLSPFFTTKNSVIDAWQNLKESAREQGLLIAGKDEKILFKSECSTFTISGIPHFIIEVPLFPATTTFELYKFLDSPLTLNNLTFHIRPQNPYLVIDNLKSVSREISKTDFEECQKVGNMFNCKFEKIYNKGLTHKPSCLVRLLTNNYADLHKYCPLTIDPNQQESISQQSLNEFRVYSREGTTITISCKNSTLNTQISVKGTELIKLPAENCQGSSPSFVFYGSLTLLTESDVFTNHALIDHKSLLGITVLTPEQIENLHKTVSAMQESSPLKDIDVNSVTEKLHEQHNAILNDISDYRIEIYLGIALFLLGFLIPCFFYLRRRRANHLQDDNSRNSRELHVHYAVPPESVAIHRGGKRRKRPAPPVPATAPPYNEDGVSLLNAG